MSGKLKKLETLYCPISLYVFWYLKPSCLGLVSAGKAVSSQSRALTSCAHLWWWDCRWLRRHCFRCCCLLHAAFWAFLLSSATLCSWLNVPVTDLFHWWYEGGRLAGVTACWGIGMQAIKDLCLLTRRYSFISCESKRRVASCMRRRRSVQFACL